MSASRLREAAALMRSRAEMASAQEDGSADAWWVEVCPDNDAMGVVAVAMDDGLVGDVIAPTELFSAQHIASWHPAVALAVADWLELSADRWALNHTHMNWRDTIGDPALAVADAYLGSP